MGEIRVVGGLTRKGPFASDLGASTKAGPVALPSDCEAPSSSSRPPALRRDLIISRQETDSGSVFIVKAPATGRFFRLREAEHFIAQQLDGSTSLAALQHRFDEEFGTPLPRETADSFVGKLRELGLLETEHADRRPPITGAFAGMFFTRG